VGFRVEGLGSNEHSWFTHLLCFTNSNERYRVIPEVQSYSRGTELFPPQTLNFKLLILKQLAVAVLLLNPEPGFRVVYIYTYIDT
jgi:hypothetical protein